MSDFREQQDWANGRCRTCERRLIVAFASWFGFMALVALMAWAVMK